MKTVQYWLRTWRDPIKGVAILWVVFFHAQLGLSGMIYDVQKIGYGGVDLFFFLSGFGLYHSLNRNGDIADYARRRAMRLLPSYVPFCVLWLGVMIPLSKPGLAGMIRMAMGNLFMVGDFSGAPVVINWYVSALLLSLLLAPFFYGILKNEQNRILRSSCLIAGLFLMGLAFVDHDLYTSISRLPVFALGMALGGCKSEKPGRGVLLAGSVVMLTGGVAVLLKCFRSYPELLMDYAMYWHPFFLIAPALCVLLGQFFDVCPKVLIRPLALLGEASFEIFLFNVWVELLGKRYGLCQTTGDWLMWSIASVLCGILYHLGVKWTCQKKSKKTQKGA